MLYFKSIDIVDVVEIQKYVTVPNFWPLPPELTLTWIV